MCKRLLLLMLLCLACFGSARARIVDGVSKLEPTSICPPNSIIISDAAYLHC